MTWYHGADGNPFCRHYRRRQLPQFLAKVDVLYVRVDWNLATVRRMWMKRLRLGRLPVVWELNGLPEELFYLGRSEDELRKVVEELRSYAVRVDAAIAVTEKIERFLAQDVGVRRTYCIPNGSDPKLFGPGPESSKSLGPLQIVWIGTSRSGWHDLDTLLSAAQTLAASDANVLFRIYGDPSFLPNDLPSNTRACGAVPYSEMGRTISDADVGLHLFKPLGEIRVAGSPLKLFDYMASGLAVIAQDEGQRGAIIRQREVGLTTSGAPDDLARQISKLEQDRDLCRRFGKNGRLAVEEYYNWDRAAEETEAVLRGVLK